jgi:hypothetical protein
VSSLSSRLQGGAAASYALAIGLGAVLVLLAFTVRGV